MSKPMLQTAGIVTVIGQLEATSVPEHVRMNCEWHQRHFAKLANELIEANGGHGCAAFSNEDVGASYRVLPAQPSQSTYLVASNGMDGWHAHGAAVSASNCTECTGRGRWD